MKIFIPRLMFVSCKPIGLKKKKKLKLTRKSDFGKGH